jgi:DNA polymerase-4
MFVLGEATILHADCDAFFASVAQRDDPSLRGRPVAVGPGIVMAATYEARAFGVRSAMPAEKAKRLCPELVVVSSDFDAYVKASRQLFKVFRDTAPVVEGMSLEEAFLDVRGLERISGHPVEIAIKLRRRVREEIGLPLSVGIARTKGVAKMASKLSKPEGLLAVGPAGELPFLHPLRVEQLWGVGASTASRLHAAGIETVGQVAAMTGRSSSRYSAELARGASTRLRWAAIRGGCGSAQGAGRWGRNAEWASPASRPRTSTRRSSPWSIASQAGCERAGTSDAR